MATYRIVKRILIPVSAVLAAPIVVPALQAQEEGKSKKIKPKDLPIYDNPEDLIDYEVIDKSQTALVKGIRTVRISITEQFESLTDVRERLIEFIHTGTEHTKNTLEYLNDESNVLPRAAAITLGGLGGLLFSIRGGILKKLIYSSTGFAAMASVCYPQQAAQISQDAYKIGKYYAIIGYNNLYEAAGLGQVNPNKPSSKASMDTIAEQVSDVHYYGFRLLSNDPPGDDPPATSESHGKTAEECPTRRDDCENIKTSETLDRNIIDTLIDPVTGTYVGHPCDQNFSDNLEDHLRNEDCKDFCQGEEEDDDAPSTSLKKIDSVVLPFKRGKTCDCDESSNVGGNKLYIDDLINPSVPAEYPEAPPPGRDFNLIDKFIEPYCNCPPPQPEKPQKRIHFPRLWGGEKCHDEFREDSEETSHETQDSSYSHDWSYPSCNKDQNCYSSRYGSPPNQFLHERCPSADSCTETVTTKKENYCNVTENYDESCQTERESASEIQLTFTSEIPCNHSQNFYGGAGISDRSSDDSACSSCQQFEYVPDECSEENDYIEEIEIYEETTSASSNPTYNEEFECVCEEKVTFIALPDMNNNFLEDASEYTGDAGESCTADTEDRHVKRDRSYLQLILTKPENAKKEASKTDVTENASADSAKQDNLDETYEMEEADYDEDYDEYDEYKFDEEYFTDEELEQIQSTYKILSEETFDKFEENVLDESSEEPFDMTDLMSDQIS